MATLTHSPLRSIRKLALCILLPAVLTMTGCAPSVSDGAALAEHQKIAMLARDIGTLGPDIDPQEATMAAAISIRYAKTLRARYKVSDRPLVHNSKVNMGLRPRGLCYHWADDIEARLEQENFRTLDLHRAIANSTNIRIEHSVVIVSAPGKSMFDGIVLDGWRQGGDLYWAHTRQDAKYRWEPRDEVFARKRRRLQLQ